MDFSCAPFYLVARCPEVLEQKALETRSAPRPEHPCLCVGEGAGWVTADLLEMNSQTFQAGDPTSVPSVTHGFRPSLLSPLNQEADSACAGQAGLERARTRVFVKACSWTNTMQRQPGFLFCFVFVGAKNENKEPF